jgi:hypothetical protein
MGRSPLVRRLIKQALAAPFEQSFARLFRTAAPPPVPRCSALLAGSRRLREASATNSRRISRAGSRFRRATSADSWRHRGFRVHNAVRVRCHDAEGRNKLAR